MFTEPSRGRGICMAPFDCNIRDNIRNKKFPEKIYLEVLHLKILKIFPT